MATTAREQARAKAKKTLATSRAKVQAKKTTPTVKAPVARPPSIRSGDSGISGAGGATQAIRQGTRTQPGRESVGIRPGQFGEINESGTRQTGGTYTITGEPDITQEEARQRFLDGEGFFTPSFEKTGAGERVTFDKATGKASVVDAQGNFIRDAGDATTIGERTQRSEPGAPLGAGAGVQGVSGQQGFNPAANNPFLGGGESELQRINREISENESMGGVITTGGSVEAGGKIDTVAMAQRDRTQAIRRTELKKQQATEEQRMRDRAKDEAGTADVVTEQVTPESSGGNAALANLAAGNPQAQAMMPFIQQYLDDITAQQAKSETFQAEQIADTKKTFDSVGTQIEDMKNEYRTSTDAITDFLKEAKESSDEQLALQQESARNQLKWVEVNERMGIIRRKAEVHDSLVVQLALEGGFGQPAALKGIMETDNAFDESLTQLATNFAFKRTDLATKFAGLELENKQNYITNTINNMKEMRSAMERITTLGIQNTQKEQTAINSIMEKGFERQNEFILASSKTTMDAAKEIQGIISDDKQDKLDRKEAAEKHLLDVFGKTEPGSSMRAVALKNAQAAGMNTIGIDINDEVANASGSKDERSMELHDITPYLDDPVKLALIGSAEAVASKAVKTHVDPTFDRFKKMIDAGKHKEAIEAMTVFGKARMGTGMANNNATRSTIVIKSGELLQQLKQLEDTGQADKFFSKFGEAGRAMQKRADNADGWENLEEKDFTWYRKEIENLKNIVGKSKDPELQDVYAKVEALASFTIHELFGAAVTPTEMARGRQFIALSGDTLEDMKSKLRNYAEIAAEQNRQELETVGLAVSVFMPGLTSEFPITTPTDDPPVTEATDSELLEMMDEIERDYKSMGEVSYTVGDYVTKEYDGRRVELKKPVMMAFNSANDDFREDYGMDIRVGAEKSATKRDQAETIKDMAKEAGIEFFEENPNYTAYQLRDMGRQVANVGFSKHETGEAVDLYPKDIVVNGQRYTGHEYIELVKPYLERYGIMQANHKGIDPGNFEYSQTS